MERLRGTRTIHAGRFCGLPEVLGYQPNPPTITGFYVYGLAHPDFLVEMDAIAVVPL